MEFWQISLGHIDLELNKTVEKKSRVSLSASERSCKDDIFLRIQSYKQYPECHNRKSNKQSQNQYFKY